MIKLLICLFAGVALAATTLQLRQQRLELNYQNHKLHNQIEGRQSKLWNQQLQIAVYTAPNSIAQTVGNQHLKLTAATPARAAGQDENAE